MSARGFAAVQGVPVFYSRPDITVTHVDWASLTYCIPQGLAVST